MQLSLVIRPAVIWSFAHRVKAQRFEHEEVALVHLLARSWTSEGELCMAGDERKREVH